MKELKLFGKKGCAKCESTKNKIEHLKKEISQNFSFDYYDLDTLDGLTEGSYYGVYQIPTTIIVENGIVVKRWEGIIPPTEELLEILERG